MLHESFQYLGQNVTDNFIIADKTEYAKILTYSKNLAGRSFQADDVLTNCPQKIKTASCLTFRGKTILNIPAWLHQCSFLEYLAIPLHLGNQLNADSLPQKLKTIEFIGEGIISLPCEIIHNGIERIIAWNATVLFDPQNFQSLHHFHMMLDRKRRPLSELINSDVKLNTLTVCPFLSVQEIEPLCNVGIQYLRLVSGKASSLDGLEYYKELTDIHLHDLSKLERIQPLTKLLALNDLSIGYCNKIKDLDVLLEIKTLRKLSFYGCNKLPIKDNAAAFRKMKLQELDLGI